MPFDVDAAIKEYKEGRSGKGQRKLVDAMKRNTKNPGQLAIQQLGKARQNYAQAAMDGGLMEQGLSGIDTSAFNKAVIDGASRYGSVTPAQEAKLRKRLQAQKAARDQAEQEIAAAKARGDSPKAIMDLNFDLMSKLKGLR